MLRAFVGSTRRQLAQFDCNCNANAMGMGMGMGNRGFGKRVGSAPQFTCPYVQMYLQYDFVASKIQI